MKKTHFLSLALIVSILLFSCQQDNIADEVVLNTKNQTSQNKNGHICLEKFPPSLKGKASKGSVLQQYIWTPGQTIRVKFLNGDSFLQQKVIQYASEWMNYANLKFAFVPAYEDADIKINFDSSNTSWSYYGNSSQSIAQNSASMNFGWFNASTPDSEFSRTTIHEFGHAIGMVHEHQQPNVDIPWNKPAVYAYFGGYPNFWNAQQVDNNIFNRFNSFETNSSGYDKASIMHYFFPDGLTTDGSTFTQNNVLSPTDKSFIGQVYPFSIGTTKSILYPNEILYANEYLTSPNGRFICIMQGDGNLVVYQDGFIPLWSSNTHGTPSDRCIMQGDGNLVLYSANFTPYWDIKWQSPGAYAVMQDDGNFVVYNNGVAIWSWMSGLLF
jgi:hypothetical protein